MKKLILTALSLLAAAQIFAQTTREDIYSNPELSAGLLCVYPGPQGTPTKAPKGYKPFYISHFARHGSRYLADMEKYTTVLDALRDASKADALTDLGKDLLSRIEIIWADARGRDGELTRKGVEQHRGIAERMYRNYPQVFKGDVFMTARSTQVPRCMLSMDAFCERLKELNPDLRISRDASGRDRKYISARTKEYEAYIKEHDITPGLYEWCESCVHPDRLTASVFSSQEYIDAHVDKSTFMLNLFEIAGDMQDVDLDISLYDLFQKEELYDLWQSRNASFYGGRGPNIYGGEVLMKRSIALLKHILETADEAIETGNSAATLRFSHDSYLAPLCTTMRLSDCMGTATSWDQIAGVWSNYKVAPMAGNVQLVFFRNKAGDVIVKFLHNEAEVGIPAETDIYPFYHWDDVKAYYQTTYDYINEKY